MVGVYDELSFIEVLVEPLAKASLSSWEYLFSDGARVRNAKAIGFSVPSSMTWDRTAPIPYGEASQSRTSCFWGRSAPAGLTTGVTS